jgi:hypothetical protein
VNVILDPTLKEDVVNGKTNSFKCEKCGYEQELLTGFLYHDMDNQIMAWVLKQSDRGNQELVDNLKKGLQNVPPSMSKKLQKASYQPKHAIVFGFDELFALMENSEKK